MGRFGWSALAGLALISGFAIQNDDFHDGVIGPEIRMSESTERIESRIRDIEERIDRRAEQIAESVEDRADAVEDTASTIADDAEEAATSTEDADERIARVTAQIQQLRDDGQLTEEEYQAMLAQLGVTPETEPAE